MLLDALYSFVDLINGRPTDDPSDTNSNHSSHTDPDVLEDTHSSTESTNGNNTFMTPIIRTCGLPSPTKPTTPTTPPPRRPRTPTTPPPAPRKPRGRTPTRLTSSQRSPTKVGTKKLSSRTPLTPTTKTAIAKERRHKAYLKRRAREAERERVLRRPETYWRVLRNGTKYRSFGGARTR